MKKYTLPSSIFVIAKSMNKAQGRTHSQASRSVSEPSMEISFQTKNQRIRARHLKLTELTTADIQAWRQLDDAALEPNAYLSPHFLIPALRHLDPQQLTTLSLLEREVDSGWELCALVPLQKTPADRFMPLPHYRVQLALHAFMDGLLVRRDGAKVHLEMLFEQWCRTGRHGVVLRHCHVDGPTDTLLKQIASQQGLQRVEVDAFERAVMRPSQLGDTDLATRLPSRAKKFRAAKNKLAKLGPVRFVTYRGTAITNDVIDRHLTLEHMGWKGENGSSLRSKPEHEQFFREMVNSFSADDRGFFAELWVGDRLLHSSSNLTSGKTGFAFKVGFDPEFSQLSPGIIGELELMRCAPQALADLETVDSGSVSGSFIEELWPLRHKMATVVYATSQLGNLALKASNQARAFKRKWAERRTAAEPVKSGETVNSTVSAPLSVSD